MNMNYHDMDAFLDFDMYVKERKTRRDVFTVWDAMKSHKSSKDHKLGMRSVKRDKTKMAEGKEKTMMRRAWRM